MLKQEMKQQCDDKRYEMIYWIYACPCIWYMLIILGKWSTEMSMSKWLQDTKKEASLELGRQTVLPCSSCKLLMMNMMRRQRYLFFGWNLWNKDNRGVFSHRQHVTMLLRFCILLLSSCELRIGHVILILYVLYYAQNSCISLRNHFSLLRQWSPM